MKAQHTEIEDSYQLSPMQQGMLFHSLYAPHSGVYIQQMICTLRENLHVSAFERAWQRVMERHPVLRTSFRWEGVNVSAPLQEVQRHVRLPLEHQDWREMSARQRKNRLEAYLQADRQRGFNLTVAPLMRLALFRVAEARYQCIWTSHHALLDGRSRLLVLKELFAFYEAFCQGRDLQLQRLRPYRDYIDWLGKQDLTKAESFWRRTLKGFTAPTPLVVDRAHRTKSDEEGYGKQGIRFSEALTSALQSLAQQHQLTPNTLLQGAWALLLSRYSGEEEIVFGATRACRRSALEEAESMVGLFINTLPVRARVSPEKGLLPWLKELRAQWMAMEDYEHTPLVEVQGWSEMPAGKPLFESILVFENHLLNSTLRAQGGGWKNREFRLLGPTNYPLTVTGYLERELLLEIGYERRRFDDATIARMLGHFQRLLESFVANPEQRLSELPILTDKERQQLLVEWNNTAVEYPQDQCIHQLFEAQVERTPEAVAVVFEQEQLTYRELNQRANQLAHHLQALGVGPEVLVGICMERSVEMIVALLGILKAGGAYVPLDPAYPQERLSFMLEDAEVPVLLAQQHVLERLPEHRATVLCLDTDWQIIAQQSTQNPINQATAEHLAYVIYTSGSTGRPKGVCVPHRGVVRLVTAADYVNLASDEVFLQFAPMAFDASTFEIWGALLNGAQLVVFPPHMPSLAELGQALQRHRVTTLWLSAGLFHLMVEEHLESLRNVRQLLAGGDVLSVSHVEKALAGLEGCQLINGYGPTESTTFACCYPVISDGLVGLSVPIGRPIANTQVYVLDGHLQPVPVGVPGELYIGGDGLARGYLNQPELTAERFIPHPFSNEPGERLYKTGDLVRYLPDGNIEFLGRADHQVKIHGFRIELGEIEAVLGAHLAVRESVVIAREDKSGVKRLLGYVVPHQDQTPTISELRSYLKQKLPDYMVPASFMLLEALPLTPNGKVDRGALPAPDQARPELEATFVAPQTPVEEVLAGIWAQVLGLKQVGIYDNFFELGGHSLLATQVISRVRTTLQVELPLRCLFESPTVIRLAERVEATGRVEQGLQSPPMLPVIRDAELPLSFAQQRLWFLDQLEPGSSLYNIAQAIRINGALNVEALHQTFEAIVARHESLRARFAAMNGSPAQVIAPTLSVTLPVIDLCELPEMEREAEAQRLAAEEAQRSFDLARGPLVRASLLRLGAEVHILLLTMHHIVSDGWSMGVFFRELAALYEAFSTESPSPLPELAIQYVDFARWQREWLTGAVLEKQLAYWKHQLNGAPAALELPTDRPRPVVQGFRGAKQSLVLSKQLTEGLKALSQREGVTLFMTLLAAFQTLLLRYTQQEDIVVGSPIANRNQTEVEGLIGFFVNTLVLRTDLSGDPSFRELLGRVREVALGAYAHQDLPFEKLVEELRPERSLSHTPLLQVMFALQNAPGRALELAGLRLHPLEVERGAAKFDLTLSLVEEAAGLRARLDYNTDLFEAATMRRMLGHYQTLLEGIAVNPERRLSRLPLLTEAERDQLLVEWNETQRAYPQEQCLHELFEAQAERTPNAVAVVCEDQELTYRELNRRANQVAHYLRKRGVGPEALVGICLERSLEMTVGLLGILKAGGAYVPLDPAYPKERLAYMLADAEVRVLLTQERLVRNLPEHQARVVCLDADWKEISAASIQNPVSEAKADNLLYVIYTSGSTGRAKGAMLDHRGIVNCLLWLQATHQLSEVDRVLLKASLSFDASAWELFWPLLVGAGVVVARPGGHQDSTYLVESIVKHGITTVHFVPSMFQVFLDERGLEAATSLKRVICGGEALPVETVERSFRRLSAELHNFYGPTETSIGSLNWPCKRESNRLIVPIGRPVANTQVYVLDKYIKPVPVGVAGELHIGGVGLARGYLNRPELTAEKFIPNPFSDEPGARLYKTGDLARYLPDGNIEFLGRIDHQVKVRGFRIELGEIEAVLAGHEGVRETVVVAREDEPGEKRLVAYLVTAQEPGPTVSELRSFLTEKLPDYMVPSAFVLLDELPLTPNGKVDRRALPAPDHVRPELDEAFVAPRTPVEEVVAGIWANVLGIDQVGVYDNFFELGGHSLKATQVVSRLREAFRIDLPLRSLFESPTVSGLAVRVEAIHRADEGLQAPPMLPVSRDGELPLSFAQQRLWFLDQLEPGSSAYNIPLAIRLSGALNIEALQQTIEAIVGRHESLRTVFAAIDGEPVQVVSESVSVALSVVDLRQMPQSEREVQVHRLATKEAQRPFNLASGPLVRSSLLRLDEEEYVLLLTMHHIICDGWSFGVFFRELAALYDAFTTGKPSPLSELPIHYADYAVWQRQWLQGEVLEKQLSYWKQQLAGAPAVLELPSDRQRPAVQTFQGARQSIVLSKGVSEALNELSRREGVTLFMTLLAAFQTLLSRYTGQQDIVVGSPVAGRTRAETEELIGFFVNTLVLRTDLSGDPTFRELLGRVREVALGAYAHQDVPFEKLVEELQPERDLSRHPIFDVMFNLVNTPQPALELPGLTLSSLRLTEPQSKFSMTLYVQEQQGELNLQLVYQHALFSDDRIACFVNQFRYLLEQIVAAPENPVRSYSLITPESRRLLPDPTAVLPEPRYEFVTETFLSWAKRTPDQPAIRQGDNAWTYGELAASVHALARVLLAQGLEPGDVVAVLGPRSFGLMASMMAVFLSRGVLLAIDRTLPADRQRLMIQQAGAKHLLYIGHRRSEDEWMQELSSLAVTDVDPDKGRAIRSERIQHREAVQLPALEPDDAAYIFFTSGTTGIPKAVLGCHKGLSHFLTWQRETFAIGPQDHSAQLTSLSFDMVLRDIFLPLTSGATLCLPEELDEVGAGRIIAWLERERISLLHTVPALAQSWLIDLPQGISLRALRWVFFAGEPLTESLVRRWREAFPEAGEIVNLYGPTETTMVKCCYRVPTDMRPGVQPVGWPLPETQALVLSEHSQLCGIGEIGEIVLRTPFRSLGYINADEENQQRFVMNPFRDDEGDALYRTGDRGRYHLDGSLEILGRLDHQVKVRGIRIELGEIEAVLAGHAMVQQSVVMAREDEPGEKRLIAYVIPQQGQTSTISELRSYLKQKLPEYMMPSAFVMLDAMPLTPNGKVDRCALPAPDQARPELEKEFVAPRTAVEEVLAGVWAEVLGLERVGIHDNFFELGGHSLLATQVTSRVRTTLQVELPLRSLFETPTVAGLAERIKMARQAAQGLQAPPLRPVSHNAELPLSFAQQRLWFLEEFEPGSPVYNIPTAMHLKGRLNVDALEQSLNEIMRRHKALRTNFAVMDGRPVQVIAPALALTLSIVDLRELPETAQKAEVRRLVTEEAQRPFDLARGLLLRATLLRLGEEDHMLLLTMHHIASDGWSMGVVFRELSVLYEAYCTGKSSPLPELPIQYVDFALWQQQWLQGEVLERQLSYWKRQLGGRLPVLELPTDRPRPAVQIFQGARQSVVLPATLTRALKVLSQREGVTLFMMLLAAFKTLLYRYTGQGDIVVGSPIANRNRAEIEGLIGYFINILVLRADLSGNPTFRELLNRVREVALGAYAHQDVPFEKLVEVLALERDLSRNPLFQVMFVLQNAPLPALELVGLTLSPLKVERGTAKFDLTLSLVEREQGLIGSLEYNTDLFDVTTINRMLGHFQSLLEGIVANPDQRLSELPLLTEAERHQLLVEWNNTAVEYPQDQCIHQLFEQQVERTAEAVAVVFEQEQLTYRELNQRANQLAHHLQALGVGPEVLVGICMERSLEMVVGLLGILKAGGAYVPLDPAYPWERLAFMLEDAQVPVLLTQERSLEGLPEHKAHVICLDRDWERVAGESIANPCSGVTANNLAYVIYTSGSTGRPKGAMNTHHGICNLLLWMQAAYSLTETDLVLQKTPFSFDVSVSEFFQPLLNGARLVVARPGGHQDSAYLVELIAEQQISTVQFVPSMLQVFLDENGLENCHCLRQVLCGGEALPFKLQEKFFARLNAKLHNLYGPTEATIDATYWECRRDVYDDVVPIGRPIANTQIYILDRHLNPVPIGVPGELHIGGAGLARGYLNRPELTAAKFIANPFSNEPGARLYKTGDLARYLPDGNIEYLRRIDHQVKLRGFRIELGEIETVLSGHPAVQETVVVAREDSPGEKRLVAYLVATEGEVPSVSELRSYLKEKLPEYMVPSAFVMLDAMPLTPNGKVDRCALPAPDQARPEFEKEFVAPRTAVEEVLAAIWATVLKLERIGIHDNFFELGGHSLLATRVISRVRTTLQVELPLRSLFETPTLADLAERIEATRRAAGENLQAPPLRPVSHNAELPLSFAQQRLWFLNQLQPDSPLYNIARAIHINGALNVAALHRTLDAIIARHESLRTSFAAVNGSLVQVLAPTLIVRLPLIDLCELPESERAAEAQRLAAEEAQRPFDLAQGPLFRASLLRLNTLEHILLLTMHHIVSDGWSMGVLFREITELYEAFSAGRASPLPELPIQYADYAIWQRQWLRGEVLDKQLAYWRAQLAGAPPVLELPTDRPHPAVQSFRGATQSLLLPRRLNEELKALSQREGATLFMTLLAAFKTLLYRYTGQEEIVVGSPIAGRNRAEIEGLIGFFVNTLVVRTDLSGNPSFRELLRRVREVALGAYAHQDVPFEKLVEELQLERDLSRNPLFQVMFVLQNAPLPALELVGLTLSPLKVERGTAKFDLTLSLVEREQGLIGSLEYNTDLFDAATMSRMLAQYQTLLEGIVADPDQRLSQLPLLTEAERHQLLVEWNDTQTEYSKNVCIHELFEAQVEQSPDTVAVVFEEQQLTYRELNARANQLAYHLRKFGVGPDVLVGICMERSLEMVVGLLGILKAGGAYVPLDPAYPQERLAFMVKDAEVPVLLTQQRLVELLPENEVTVICLDTGWEAIAQENMENPIGAATADNLAYVIYTSGSTGGPKGVLIEQRQLMNYIFAVVDRLDLAPRASFAMVQPLTVDSCNTVIYPSLFLGGCLHLMSQERASDAQRLGEYFRRYEINCLKIAPSHLAALQTSDHPEQVLPRNWLILGGEPSHWDFVQRLQSVAPDCVIFNHYGPTETTVGVLTYRVGKGEPGHRSATVPIGRPIDNTQIYLLDRYLQPVPIGVPGELHIGGGGLARGYLNRPELTAEKFIPHPFSTEPGARLYKTGDLARYLPDGNIEYLGRMDHQVKVRGFRIELGEIEAVLGQHPAVRETVVMVRENELGDKRLVAYIVSAQEQTASISESPTTRAHLPCRLRSYLKEKLPEYMVPSAFVMLDELPLMAHGKVDRRALPAPDQARPELEKEFVAPRTAVEEVLAGIWANILGVEQVGVHDNFFELGGHSLLATQVISRLRTTLQVELPLRSLFETPTVAGLAERIEATRRAAGEDLQAPPLRPVSHNAELPLSFAQQRLWFLDQLEPDSPLYNIARAIRISGALNVEALHQTLDAIVARHESLRTSFTAVDGEPIQVIAERGSVALLVIDLCELPEAQREAEVQLLAMGEAQRPFDLAGAPLVRASLLRLDAAEHILLLTMHHIVSDGWSMGVLFREITALYEAFSAGKASPLPELTIQYADYAVWQREWLTGEVLEKQLSYWIKQLSGAPAGLELLTDRARPAVQSFRGAKQSVVLSKSLSERLKALSREEGATLFMTLLAAFQTLLMRYTHQEDVVVGTPIANRNCAEIEGLIGFFVNTLVLRTDLSGDPSFRELLRRVREVALGAYAHQDLPFEKLVEELQPERDLSRAPLFQVLFSLQNAPGASLELSGLTLRTLATDSETSKFDLGLFMWQETEGVRASLAYSTDLFEAATITRMLGHLETLLEGIVADPDQRVSELPLLTEAERHQLLVEWNDTQTEYSKDVCIHELFETQVEQTPDTVAVAFEDQQLTYRELNARANQLAYHLRKFGVGPEVLVGICMERSLEMVVGLLGILKAGGAYVPLDPAYPRERLAFMMKDAEVPVLLTQQRLVELLPEYEVKVICLDTGWEAIAQGSEGNPVSGATAENLAYVIYTSGSTGKPKGVAMSQRSLLNLLSWQLKSSTLPRARTLQFASLSFDVSFQEIFSTWCAGGTLVLISEELRRDAVGLLRFITDEAVARLFLPFVALQQLAEVTDGRLSPTSLREIITAGEQLQITPHIASLFSKLKACTLHNHYGPSESHIVTAFTLTDLSSGWVALPPIGRPLDNTQIYLLDRHLNPVPIGVPGELHIGGAGLARGYLNRPELTAAKFIANPFSNEPGARLYKTGDLARYLPDGNIEFLGRIDHQVKIRGFRIELGEIEAVLVRHPGVRETVVLAREDVPGDKRLVAYVIPDQKQKPTVSELRSFLQQKMPDYMVPSAFVMLDAMPLTANGKVDRRALPAPDYARPELEEDFVVPRTPVEEVLAGIWADVLGIEQMGVHDNFFELGGHSLQAMQLASKMSAAMNLDISVKLLFLHPSIAALADALEDLPRASERSRRAPSKSVGGPVSGAPPEGFDGRQPSFPMKIERRPLLSLFATGKIAPVDAAALGYLPSELLERTGLSRNAVIHGWYDNLPTLSTIMENSLGRVAIIRLPRFSSELYDDEEDLVGVILEALEIAGRLGARTVSLTGLIPSATDYGRAIATAISGRKHLPMISTGHATTAATVVLAIRRILQESGRNLAQERVGFLGLGSIGLASLRLMLRCLPHPAEITLCDVYSKLDSLERIQQELVGELGVRGSVRVIESRAELPPEFYDATLIIGATNVPDILDITRVNPGTMIVDDSGPHCFALKDAVERFRKHGDILFTEGGVLRSPHPISQLRYVPRAAEQVMNPAEMEALSKYNPFQITGCVLSGLLSSCFEDLKPTVGFIDDSSCLQHYEQLSRLGFQAADLHCGGYVLTDESIRNFRYHFGGTQEVHPQKEKTGLVRGADSSFLDGKNQDASTGYDRPA